MLLIEFIALTNVSYAFFAIWFASICAYSSPDFPGNDTTGFRDELGGNLKECFSHTDVTSEHGTALKRAISFFFKNNYHWGSNVNIVDVKTVTATNVAAWQRTNSFIENALTTGSSLVQFQLDVPTTALRVMTAVQASTPELLIQSKGRELTLASPHNPVGDYPTTGNLRATVYFIIDHNGKYTEQFQVSNAYPRMPDGNVAHAESPNPITGFAAMRRIKAMVDNETTFNEDFSAWHSEVKAYFDEKETEWALLSNAS
tara:strand:+ start:2323 stop:3096 length:774 start_codon:yes stop_codon:yes gene_type:complete